MVTIVAYVFTFRHRVEWNRRGSVSAIALFSVPALIGAIPGLLVLRALGGRQPTGHQHAR